jgi:hypothetical protein
MLFGVRPERLHGISALGGFRRPLRDAVSCYLPYPPVKLAGYFREPPRGIASKLWIFVLRGRLSQVWPSRMVMTALFVVDATAR